MEGFRMTILIIVAFVGGALADHYLEAKVRTWLQAKKDAVKAAL